MERREIRKRREIMKLAKIFHNGNIRAVIKMLALTFDEKLDEALEESNNLTIDSYRFLIEMINYITEKPKPNQVP